MSIGLVGAGRMAQALTRGIIRSGFISPEKVIASAHIQDREHLEKFSDFGCRTSTSNQDVAKESDIIVVAVKPSVVPEVLRDISSVVSNKHLIVSVALGVSLKYIEKILPSKTRVIRVMPNTPCVVMQGASVFAPGSCSTIDDAAFVKRMFSCVGICEEVVENYMDAITGLSGSGPAYIYLVIEALADGGVKMGLARDLALKLAAQTVLGSAKMVLEEKRHPGSLKDDVTSPGGCTIHALHLLEQAGLRALFMSAVQEATQRAQSMAADVK